MIPRLRPNVRGPFKVWMRPDRERAYVMGVDTSSGKSLKDSSAVVVIEAKSGAQVATWHGHIDPTDLAYVILMIGTYFGAATEGQTFCVLETNNHGHATLSKLREIGYWSLYMRKVWNKVEQTWIDEIGFWTDVKSRPVLIGRGRSALKEKAAIVRDPALCQQMGEFVHVLDKDGNAAREDHVAGGHDDILIAWMLAQEGRYSMIENGLLAPSEQPRQNRDAWAWEQLDRRANPEKYADEESRGVYYEDTWS